MKHGREKDEKYRKGVRKVEEDWHTCHGVPKRQVTENWTEAVLEEIMPDNFSELIKKKSSYSLSRVIKK